MHVFRWVSQVLLNSLTWALWQCLYRVLTDHLRYAGVSAAPFVAGAAARAVTAFAVSPMELIRVRVQGSAAPAGVPYAQQLLSTVRSIHAQGEVRWSSYTSPCIPCDLQML